MKNLWMKTGTILAAAVAMNLAAPLAGAKTTHQVKKGETLWGISQKYSVTVDELLALNPSLSGGLKADTSIDIPDNGAAQKENSSGKIYGYNTADINRNYYTAKFGDSFKSISQATGASMDTLRALNPFLDGGNIAEGTIVRISSAPVSAEAAGALSLVDSLELKMKPAGLEDLSNNGLQQTLVLALPFDPAAVTINRQNMLATEFYKGLLLALYQALGMTGVPPAKVVVIDSGDGPDQTIKQIKALGLGKNSVIIPADDEALISAIGKFCADSKIPLLNVLSIRDTGYTANPYIIQCNINQQLMYSKAIGYILSELADYTPVILNPSGGGTDKVTFVDALKKSCDAAGKEVVEISYSKMLTEKDTSVLKPGRKYVFIPRSGSAEAFESFARQISDIMAENADTDRFCLFGYPEWITFTGDNETALHNMKARIYSRFFIDPNDIITKDVLQEFQKWYGDPMMNAFPMQGMLGYDTANLILRSLRHQWADSQLDKFRQNSYTGEQSTFHFIQDSGSKGFINDALYIIEYMPGETHYIKVI